MITRSVILDPRRALLVKINELQLAGHAFMAAALLEIYRRRYGIPSK